MALRIMFAATSSWGRYWSETWESDLGARPSPYDLLCRRPPSAVGGVRDSSVNLFCRPWVKTKDYWTVHWDLTRQVKERFDAEGISIPVPQRDVHTHPEAVPT